MKKILIIFILFINCKSTINNDFKAKYKANDSEINDIVLKINKSNIDCVKNEKDLFLNSKFNSNSNYLDKLTRIIETEDFTFDENFLRKNLKILFEKIPFENISEIQVVYMQYSGEMSKNELLFLIKELNSYSIVKCSFNNYEDGVKIEFKGEDLYIMLDEYRQNLKFSYESKSLFSNSPQYFFINKIKFSQKQITSIETVFITEMLQSQKFALESYFN